MLVKWQWNNNNGFDDIMIKNFHYLDNLLFIIVPFAIYDIMWMTCVSWLVCNEKSFLMLSKWVYVERHAINWENKRWIARVKSSISII